MLTFMNFPFFTQQFLIQITIQDHGAPFTIVVASLIMLFSTRLHTNVMGIL